MPRPCAPLFRASPDCDRLAREVLRDHKSAARQQESFPITRPLPANLLAARQRYGRFRAAEESLGGKAHANPNGRVHFHVREQRAGDRRGGRVGWGTGVVCGIWDGGPGRFRPGYLLYALPAGIYFQTNYRHRHPATLGARQIGPGRAGPEVLSFVSTERMADPFTRIARPPGWHSALQSRWERRHSRG